MTARFFAEVIGDPIAHSKSPRIHNFWLRRLGIDAEYRALRVTAAQLGGYFEARARDPDWRGCNITMPHKVAALAYVNKYRDPSCPVEPINTAIPVKGRIEGINTDMNGLMEPLRRLFGGIDPSGRSPELGSRPAVVIGAGGVLYPVMLALSALGCAPITVVLRDRSKFAQVEQDYRGLHVRTMLLGEPLPSVKLLVNASPLGMTGYPAFPYGIEALANKGIVFDMVYSPIETKLLSAARARGLQTVDGLQMLVAQAAAAFKLFFGQAAPRQHDEELREILLA
ncbi:MAG: shikimate dehydrogenase [Sphingomicrobium sp.]